MVLPHITFKKGEKERDKPSAIQSSASIAVPNHQSTPSTSSIIGSPTSKYHPSWLLRRKPSINSKRTDAQDNHLSDTESLPTASSSSSFGVQLGFSPKRYASEIEESESSNNQKDWARIFPSRSNSENRSRDGNPGDGSLSSSKKAGWIYSRQTHGDATARAPTPSEAIENVIADDVFGLSESMGTLGLATDVKADVYAKIADDQDALINGMALHGRPPTPCKLSKIPLTAIPIVYPTPLSPPRRSMPQSPRAAQHMQRQQRPETPPSICHTLTGVDKPNVNSSNNRYLRPISPSPSPASSRASPRPLNQSQLPRVPVVTTEWLKRKPSTGRLRHNTSLSVDNIPVPPSHPMASTVTPPRPVQNGEKPKALDDSPQIEQRTSSNRNRTVARSFSTNSDIDGVSSSDGETGFSNPYYIPHATRPSKSITRPSGNGPDRGYEVKITCLDDRADNEEMKWQVTIRQRSPKTSLPHPTSPLQLSTTTSLAQAPATASSINLSLSLDKPTGKLVFISFPMDIHATPTTRRRRGSHSQPSILSQTSASPKNTSGSNHRPFTPPPIPGTMGAVMSRPTTPTSSGRKKPSPAWSPPIAPGDGTDSA
ncbi:hypothetical protein C365_04061 [Cryptococcus neoformans Bt85]|nr:hypothetical protein C365_04061 [Cryptococcus neoformans var. grubii Bt85]OXM78413.1 hypothetical protein C364_03841 [Cryptococcus neoformans var. grubii Bt63]